MLQSGDVLVNRYGETVILVLQNAPEYLYCEYVHIGAVNHGQPGILIEDYRLDSNVQTVFNVYRGCHVIVNASV